MFPFFVCFFLHWPSCYPVVTELLPSFRGENRRKKGLSEKKEKEEEAHRGRCAAGCRWCGCAGRWWRARRWPGGRCRTAVGSATTRPRRRCAESTAAPTAAAPQNRRQNAIPSIAAQGSKQNKSRSTRSIDAPPPQRQVLMPPDHFSIVSLDRFYGDEFCFPFRRSIMEHDRLPRIFGQWPIKLARKPREIHWLFIGQINPTKSRRFFFFIFIFANLCEQPIKHRARPIKNGLKLRYRSISVEKWMIIKKRK